MRRLALTVALAAGLLMAGCASAPTADGDKSACSSMATGGLLGVAMALFPPAGLAYLGACL